MIIDCHGHYTTAPKAHDVFREAQLAALKTPGSAAPAAAIISDDDIRETIEANQLKLQKQFFDRFYNWDSRILEWVALMEDLLRARRS